MMQPTFRSAWLPLIVAAIVLAAFNLGLYTRLSPQSVAEEAAELLAVPYFEDFATTTTMPYKEYGGDWEIRDESLVQLSTTGFDLMSFVPVALDDEQAYQFDATLRFLGGSMGGGILFNAQQTTSRQQSHMARFNIDANQLWLIYGYFGDDSDFVGQGSVGLSLTPDDAQPHQLSVQVTGETYALLVDGQTMVTDIPLMYRGGAVGLISATSQVGFDDLRIDTPAVVSAPINDAAQVVEPVETVTANTLVAPPIFDETIAFEDSFEGEGSGASLWQPISGDWRFVDGVYTQNMTNGYDLSTIYQQPVTSPMAIRTTFRHLANAGAGLLFNLSDPASRNGGHMVRYVDAGDIIAWGYFDESGAFTGQGSQPVPSAALDSHTLEIRSDASTYSVAIDGTILADNIPVINGLTTSYIGLTSSLSAVAFDDIQVYGATTNAGTSNVATTIDANTATGTWLIDGGTVTQADVELKDYVAGTGLAGEQFVVSVNIALPPENPDAGAGIIFHMEGRDDPRLGYLVRFGSGGSELFWGSYDEEGDFTGEGGIPMTSETLSHNLELVVHKDNFDIQVDGETLVEAIPIDLRSGWIGLASFSGPVTFSDIRVQLGP